MISRKRSTPENEVKLCEELILVACMEGFRVFPEVNGWDLIIVDDTGVQLGIQAKMRPNLEVLAQAVRRRYEGPRYRAVLVPRSSRAFRDVAYELGVSVFTLQMIRAHARRWNRIKFPKCSDRLFVFENMKEWSDKTLWLPPVPGACPAGSPAPRPLTQWRVKAIELCFLLEERGFLSGEDFKAAGINAAGWVVRGELVRDGKVGRFGRYVAGPRPLPIVGFEAEAMRIRDLKHDHSKTS
jgi:hypothetical protein